MRRKFRLNNLLGNIILILIILFLLYYVVFYFYPSIENQRVYNELENKQKTIHDYINKIQKDNVKCKEDICDGYFYSYLDGPYCYCYNQSNYRVKEVIIK